MQLHVVCASSFTAFSRTMMRSQQLWLRASIGTLNLDGF